MNARTLGWFAAIAIGVLILMLGLQAIVLHLHVQHPMTRLDYYLADEARRAPPWVYFRDTVVADVTLFLRHPLMVIIWLAASVLFWGVFVTRDGAGPRA
jgi:hypothetical protein